MMVQPSFTHAPMALLRLSLVQIQVEFAELHVALGNSFLIQRAYKSDKLG